MNIEEAVKVIDSTFWFECFESNQSNVVFKYGGATQLPNGTMVDHFQIFLKEDAIVLAKSLSESPPHQKWNTLSEWERKVKKIDEYCLSSW